MRILLRTTFLLALSGMLAGVAAGQTPTTTIQNGSGAPRLELNYDGGLLVPGTFGPTTPADSIPASGAGTRLMWYPAKAAFRAGRVFDNTLSGIGTDGRTFWDPANVGNYSVAFGNNTKASGNMSLAAGINTVASATNSTALGAGTEASGEAALATGENTIASTDHATAMGESTVASSYSTTALGKDTFAGAPQAIAMGNRTSATGFQSTALGLDSEASGNEATAMGFGTTAATDQSLSIGTYNSANTSADGTLLAAGNGASGSRSDALVLKKDGDLAIGPSDPEDLRLYVSKKRFGSGVYNAPKRNMVLFENTSQEDDAVVMGLQAGPQDPGTGTNYISFYDRTGLSVGAIHGNGAGGVTYKTSGADFAEELPVAAGTPAPEAGDLVAVRGDEISLTVGGADHLMIVSGQAAMTGNVKPDADGRRVPVAFVGQVPVHLRGTAEVGDLVVASGRDDGTARAVAPSDYRRAEHGPIAGQAWSVKSGDGIGTVTVAVGLGRSGAVAEQMEDQRERIAALEAENEEIQAENEEIKSRLAALERQNASALPAGLTGPWALALLLGLGALGAGLLWRRRASTAD